MDLFKLPIAQLHNLCYSVGMLTERLHVKVSQEIYKWLKDQAIKQGKSMAEVVRIILNKEVK